MVFINCLIFFVIATRSLSAQRRYTWHSRVVRITSFLYNKYQIWVIQRNISRSRWWMLHVCIKCNQYFSHLIPFGLQKSKKNWSDPVVWHTRPKLLSDTHLELVHSENRHNKLSKSSCIVLAHFKMNFQYKRASGRCLSLSTLYFVGFLDRSLRDSN